MAGWGVEISAVIFGAARRPVHGGIIVGIAAAGRVAAAFVIGILFFAMGAGILAAVALNRWLGVPAAPDVCGF